VFQPVKIVIDDKIPYIRDVISQITSDAIYLPGSSITASDVRDADALIVRTRTRCDEQLLGGSRVKFVATATIGFDHLDTEFLNRAGISWMNCPGCNSGSVAQYVRSVLILLQRDKGIEPQKTTLGIVGCGHVGSKVRAIAQKMGFRVVVSDPPLGMHCDLHECDIITYHVPLTRTGQWPTWHLADESFLRSLSRVPIIINTSRGEVVDNRALTDALDCCKVSEAVIDTWENEPRISLDLLRRVYIGTPHIAGYSADGKVNANRMVIDGLCRHFGLRNNFKLSPPAMNRKIVFGNNQNENFLQIYNPLYDSEKLKNAPEKFEELRGNYPIRREIIPDIDQFYAQ
jgi:erythronate-4-phosphate dehydrogenase